MTQASRIISAPYIKLDYSHQRITPLTLTLLFELAKECSVFEAITKLTSGDILNTTEQRAACYPALRISEDAVIMVRNHNIVPDVLAAREKMRLLSSQIRNKGWLGYSGRPITDVVNIGIGGSQLGAEFCLSALHRFITPDLRFHFIADVDIHTFQTAVKKLSPETTLFIVASKTFTTQETLINLKRALAWVNQPHHIDKHFIAVTAVPDRAKDFDIEHIIPIWDWVGGRFSTCSAINLITCIAIGFEAFMALLSGAAEMDSHFQTEPYTQNLPVLLALLSIWNNNFLHMHNHLLLIYASQLAPLLPYVQQLEMESNGKSQDARGQQIHYATAPIIWGGLGNQAQHSYYQLLSQGTHATSADLLSADTSNQEVTNHICTIHKQLLSSYDKVRQTSVRIPLNHLQLPDISPQSIGALIALYEHKVFVQGIIWHLNPFDQPGVGQSKQLLKQCVSQSSSE